MILQRDNQDAIRTLGTIRDDSAVEGDVLAQTLELPWLGNHPDTSCIPAGEYTCVLRWSPEHGRNLYWITGVEGREDVEIHIGNYPSNTRGCVLLGDSREADAIDSSTDAFDRFMAHMGNVPSFHLSVRDVNAA